MGQKASILGSKAQSLRKLEDQRRQEQEEKSASDSVEVVTIENVHVEVQRELKQQEDANLKREQEHKEFINKLQEQVKENSSLVQGLRSDLDDARRKMAAFDDKVHELETRIMEEQKASSAITKRAEELEGEIKSVRKQLETEIDLQRVKKEFEDEKAAREEAWAKISALEQEMNVAMRELDFERRRLSAATDKIVLVETHLGELHSTAEEMKGSFGKQQEQLKEMHMSLVEVEEADGKEQEQEEGEVQDKKKADAGNEVMCTTTEAGEAEMQASSGEREAQAQLTDRVEATSNDNATEKEEEQAPALVLQMTGVSN